MRMPIAGMNQWSYLCRQTVSMWHSYWCSAVRRHSSSQHEFVSAYTITACVRAKRRQHRLNSVPQASRDPLEGEPALNTAWDIMGVNRYQMDPDALWDTADQSCWNNQPVLFCLGSLSNISSEITVSETFGRAWKGRGQQVRWVKLMRPERFSSERERSLFFK